MPARMRAPLRALACLSTCRIFGLFRGCDCILARRTGISKCNSCTRCIDHPNAEQFPSQNPSRMPTPGTHSGSRDLHSGGRPWSRFGRTIRPPPLRQSRLCHATFHTRRGRSASDTLRRMPCNPYMHPDPPRKHTACRGAVPTGGSIPRMPAVIPSGRDRQIGQQEFAGGPVQPKIRQPALSPIRCPSIKSEPR
jgi:hypothetical protein